MPSKLQGSCPQDIKWTVGVCVSFLFCYILFLVPCNRMITWIVPKILSIFLNNFGFWRGRKVIFFFFFFPADKVIWGPFTHSVVGSSLKPTSPVYFALVLFPQRDKDKQLKQSVLPTGKGHFCLPWRSRHLQLEEGR